MLPMLHYICMPNFCITIVSATLLLSSQRKRKQCLCFYIVFRWWWGEGGGEGLGRREGGLARLVKVANIIRQIGVFVL